MERIKIKPELPAILHLPVPEKEPVQSKKNSNPVVVPFPSF